MSCTGTGLACAALLAIGVHHSSALGATLPDGFVHEQVIFPPFTGMTVGFAFLPDGRIVLVELDTGVVRLNAAGSATSDSIATIPDVRADHPERGLLGVAVDPEWPARPYLYFLYTHASGFERVEMWTAAGALGDATSTAITLSAPYVLLGDIADVHGAHNGGSLRFGPDGMLHVSLGEDATPCASQDVTRPNGKLLRIDVSRMPGSGPGPPKVAELDPGDNPLPGDTRYEPLVYAWGLRNPFRFTIDAPTGNIFIADVGQSAFDEVDLVPGSGYSGYDFGWPFYDGNRRIFCCDSCNVGSAVTPAIHLVTNAPDALLAITGGPVMRAVAGSPVTLPPSLDGDYFYFEVYAGTLHRLHETDGRWDFAAALPGQPNETTFADGFPFVTDAQLGPDGALYFATLGYPAVLTAGVHRIRADRASPTTAAPAVVQDGLELRVGVAPNPARAGNRVTVSWQGAGSAERVEVLDASGSRVRSIEQDDSPISASSVHWDGRDSAGRTVSSGVYLVRVVTRGGRVAGMAKVTLIR